MAALSFVGVYVSRGERLIRGLSALYKGRNMPAQVGDTAPEFTLPSVSEGDISLSQYKGEKNVVLSFHVFDFTSG